LKNPRFLPALLLLAVAVRGWTFISMDRILPLDRLYVDEVTYSSFSEMLNNRDLTRPPGMFVMGLITGMDRNVIPSRILISLLSLVPAAAVYVTFRRRRGAFLFAAGAAMSPCLIIYGTQLMPAVPAAALLSLSMASAWRGRIPLAGFLAGTAALFRAELILLPFVLIILSLGSKKIREAWGFAMF